MNDIIKQKILDLFENINLNKNTKTLKTYGSISHIAQGLIVVGFSFFETLINHYFLNTHFILTFIMFTNMNMFFLIMFQDRLKSNDIINVVKDKLFSFFRPTASLKDSITYIESKIYHSILNIENQYLYLSLFDSIYNSINQNKKIIRKNVHRKIENIQTLFEENNFTEAAKTICSLFTYIHTFNVVELDEVLITPKYSDYELKMLAIATKFSKEYIDNSKNKDLIELSKNKTQKEEEIELEVNNSTKINWRKIID